MKAPVLNKRLVRIEPCRQHTGDEQPGQRCFHRGRIVRRNACRRIDQRIHLLQQSRFRHVAEHREHMLRPDALACAASLDLDPVATDFRHATVELRNDRALFDATFDVGTHPRFHLGIELRIKVHQRHACTGAIQFKRRVDRRICATNHHHILIVTHVAFGETVVYMRLHLARHAKAVRQAEIASRHHNRRRFDHAFGTGLRPRVQAPAIIIDSRERLDRFVLSHLHAVVPRDRTVVRQCIPTRRFSRRNAERHAADRNPFRSGEERHLRRIRRNAAHQTVTLDDHIRHAGVLQRNRRRQTAGPRTNHDSSNHFLHHTTPASIPII